MNLAPEWGWGDRQGRTGEKAGVKNTVDKEGRRESQTIKVLLWPSKFPKRSTVEQGLVLSKPGISKQGYFLLPKSELANSLSPFNFLPEMNLISRGFSYFATRTSNETKTSWKEFQRNPTRRKAIAPNNRRSGEDNTALPATCILRDRQQSGEPLGMNISIYEGAFKNAWYFQTPKCQD